MKDNLICDEEPSFVSGGVYKEGRDLALDKLMKFCKE